MTKRRGTLVLLVAFALVAGACGDDSGGDEADGGRPAILTGTIASSGAPTSTVAHAYDPDDPEFARTESLDDQQQGLRAGSVDDNAGFDAYLAYLERIQADGVQLRDFDPRGRTVIRVTGSNGLPVSGAEVVVRGADEVVARLHTTADGTVRFHPALYRANQVQSFDVEVDGQSITVGSGTNVDLTVQRSGGHEGAVPLDILFLLDATGSMSDEIERLKTSIDTVAARIDEFAGAPDVRFGMTVYRDDGDEFVTRTVDFTSDVSDFRSSLREVEAAGGGDYPEALDEGLAEALAVPSWRDPADTVQLVFLVADAPPQVQRQVLVPYTESIADAVGRGVKIFPVASSESDDQAEGVFRQIAQATGGRFVFLSYGAEGAATGASTDIASADYEELALDDLIVRLVGEELAALTGRVSP